MGEGEEVIQRSEERMVDLVGQVQEVCQGM